MPGKFELYKDARDLYRFQLVSENGELILSGDGYAQKVLVLDAIVSIMRCASEAIVVDLSMEGSEALPDDDDESYPEDAGFTTKRKKRKRKGGKPGRRGKS